MRQLAIVGRLFYGIGIVALGVHQLILLDFREEIVPPLPAWAHHFIFFPILAGVALIVLGTIISGLLKPKFINTRNVCLYLGFCFLVSIVVFHLPYIFILSPNKVSRLDVWFGIGEAFAYSGGAFVIAGIFTESNVNGKNSFITLLEKLIPVGRIFYAMLIILFGFSHFVFTDFVSTMVPKWIGAPLFWTYFVGVALIGAGIAIVFKIVIKLAAFLLGIMIFLFFLFFHIPDAIANPTTGGGNEIVRAFVALLFTGVALVIAAKESEVRSTQE